MEIKGKQNPEAWKEKSVLVVGCGSIGQRHCRVLNSLGVKDIRICDPIESQLDVLRKECRISKAFTSYDEALKSKPDAVVVCTATKMHVPMSIQAIKAGASVLCEKPVSETFDGVDELERLIKETGKVFAVAFCFRFHEGLNRAKAMLAEGRIGRLVSLRLFMGEHIPSIRPDYKNHFSMKEGGVFNLNHEIDLACWFAGKPVTDVKCVKGSFGGLGFIAPDLVEMIVRFGSDCSASIHLDWFSQPRRRVTELVGTDGTITVEFASWDKCAVSLFDSKKKKWEHEELRTERDFMFRAENIEFLRAVTDGTAVSCPLSEARKSLEISCRAQQ